MVKLKRLRNISSCRTMMRRAMSEYLGYGSFQSLNLRRRRGRGSRPQRSLQIVRLGRKPLEPQRGVVIVITGLVWMVVYLILDNFYRNISKARSKSLFQTPVFQRFHHSCNLASPPAHRLVSPKVVTFLAIFFEKQL